MVCIWAAFPEMLVFARWASTGSTLGGGAWLEEVDHGKWALRVMPWPPLFSPALYFLAIASMYRLIQAPVPQPPHHADLYPLSCEPESPSLPHAVFVRILSQQWRKQLRLIQ